MPEPDALVTTDWLAERLRRPDPDLVVLDMRWREDGSGGRRYRQGHIPGARYLDWSQDIALPANPVGFMLLPPERFADAMEECGVGEDTTVLAYADRMGSGPFRLWWAWRRYGHDGVRILDGGLDRWLADGHELTAATTAPRSRGRWTPRRGDPRLLAHAAAVASAPATGAIVLDSRLPDQFRGECVWFETGPIAAGPDGIARTPRGELRAGRVPWAVNVPWPELYGPDSRMKSPRELRGLLAHHGVDPVSAGRVITYCGVGISATALLFALHRAGARDVALYDGSWDEWGRDPALPVARG